MRKIRDIPLATYRLQFSPDFGFEDAREIASYLSELGISCIYASPIFKARKGSTHGYDITDPTEVNPELGTKEQLNALLDDVGRYGMTWLQDIVPNHMAFDAQNQILVDVLENGPHSRHFHFFDVEWDHPYEGIKGRLLAPFLGNFFGESLENGELRLAYDRNGFAIHYYDQAFPLKIESYARVLTHNISALKAGLGPDHPDFIKFLGVLGTIFLLETISSEQALSERYNRISFIKVMLWELYNQTQEIRTHVDRNLKVFNGRPGHPRSMRLLEGLLLEQYFRLSFWKVATEEINYRRFFNINSLISLRIEEPRVLEHTHSLIFRLVEEGKFHGLRIDHVDGLYDPSAYLDAIRKRVGTAYVVVEKVLAHEEDVPAFWPIHGTTGYEFMNVVNGLFCEQRNKKAFDRIHARFTKSAIQFDDLVFEKKKLIAENHMAGDVDNLARLIKTISSRYRRGSDITLNGLHRAIVQVLAVFPVYRTYLSKGYSRSQDVSYIQDSLEKLKEKNPELSHELDFIKDLLMPDFGQQLSWAERAEWIHTVMRFQQFTGPLMAKGFEDTALYLYNRLISLNTVGGNPDIFGLSPRYFHRFIKKRLKSHPHSMNTSSTHDGKRGEDVRARINILSEVPYYWERTIRFWSKINRKYFRDTKSIKIPEPNDEYFLYQTLVGALPFFKNEYEEIDIPEFTRRIKEYIIKAAREGKMYTSWLKPDTEYEDTLVSFVEALLTPSPENLFLRAFLPFQRKVALYGIWNSLSQTLIKITAPGVPDFYQGTELWDLSLVDPDNRRPVDFRSRKALLRDILDRKKQGAAFLEELLATREDGRIKLYMVHAALAARNRHAELFQRGSYLPLTVRGTHKNHVIAFTRRYRQSWALTIVPRFLTGLAEADAVPIGETVWSDTHVLLPARAPMTWTNALTGERIESGKTLAMSELCRLLPTALLVSSTDAS